MKMKKIYLYLSVAVALTFTSCNEWLDIQPELEMRQTTMFESEQGFKDVLTGAYIRMATPELYGLNTTMKLPEMMAQHWTIPSANSTQAEIYHISNFDFTQTSTKKLLEDVWLQYYQTIININSLLENIDAKKDLFTNGNYELIKGEALGLRAFLHLEILRYWGPLPSKAKSSDKAIPYVKIVTKNPQELLAVSYQEVLDNILMDLNNAEELLVDDPILNYSNTILNSPDDLQGVNQDLPHPADEYHYFRQSRFNYYALKATKARYYLWIGKTSDALENALVVIDALDSDEKSKFTLGSDADANNGQMTFPAEHIFAVSSTLATQTLTPVFFNYSTAYTQTVAYLDEAFEASLHTSDIRYRNSRLWENRIVPLASSAFNFFKKYNETGSTVTAVTDIPLIRLAEMYFIVTECGRDDLFKVYRMARVLDASIDGTLTTPAAIKSRLEKEYRKEFYGEGQMFFFYKRLTYNSLAWPVTKEVPDASYKLPFPESQMSFE